MRLQGLLDPMVNSAKFKSIINEVKQNKMPIGAYGLSQGGKAYVLWSIFESIDEPMVIFASSDMECKELHENLSFFTTNVYMMQTKDIVFYNITAVSGDLIWERLRTLKEILTKRKCIVIVNIQSLCMKYVPRKVFKEYSFKIKVGDVIDEAKLIQKLVDSGYEHEAMVDNKGQFSRRGGIIDIYPPTATYPFRIELFGDEVDSIRTFNSESQRSIDKVKTVEIFPAKEIIIPRENVQDAIKLIRNDLLLMEATLKKDKDKCESLRKDVEANIEALTERGTFDTIDTYIPYFYEKTEGILDYFKNPLVILDDVNRCMGKLETFNIGFNEDYNTFLDRGTILPSQGKCLISAGLALEELKNSRVITLDSLLKRNKYLEPVSIDTFEQSVLNSYQGRVEFLINDIRERQKQGFKTLVLCGSRARGERLQKTLMENDVVCNYSDNIEKIENGQVVLTFGELSKGIQFQDLKLVIISDKEIFGAGVKKKKSKKKREMKGVSKIKSFAELKPGDYVVHVNHGIGVFKGIKQLDIDGVKKDFIEIGYSKDDKLFVPVEQLDFVQKYIGSEGRVPKVNKLGGTEWQKSKAKVKKSIDEIAEDLVKLYAERAAVTGYPFARDTEWQRQFEDEFPYEETPDQLRSIDEIKADMETAKPMDRLVCGDVGYGKTEVAMRAAFKAVMDGKQVAVLVPTTILAEQHFKSFRERFSDFPISIEMISRFKTPSAIKESLRKTKTGEADILIGTHKILGAAVKFKDLGLLVVDEEQRFGVKHKEKIKNLKKNIDVLTLTATPIPRTLHMSLTGVRSISVIETPPENRYPIQTYVVEHNDQLIRDAILKEMSRGGQIFYVYNRVETIMEMESYLNNLIPEARIISAHGRMKENELEDVMLAFNEGEYDILLATTIIETGIDIQNSNTIIIHDADKMGLSQLYQLRGRVGRTNRLAYAYLTYRKDKVLSEVAEKRLRAIKDFTELGSGFKVAMRDLEIRGAGNIMGSSQHGHMATIGYDLYCKMLEDTIKIVKGEIEEEPVETVADIRVDAYIPSTYITDENRKIEVYKKIAAMETEDEYLEIQEELIDRFSDIPKPVLNLLDIAYIRSIARRIGIVEIKDREKEIDIKFVSEDKLTRELVTKLIGKYPKEITFKQKDGPILVYNFGIRENLLSKIKEFVINVLKMIEGL